VADFFEDVAKSVSLENFSHQVWRAIEVGRREAPMRVFEKALQEPDSPFVRDESVDDGKWGVPAREEKKDLTAGFQNPRRIPNKFLGVRHMLDEVAGRDGVEGFGPEREVCTEICEHRACNVWIFDQVTSKHIGTDDPHSRAGVNGTLTGSGIKDEGVRPRKLLDGIPVRGFHVEALQIPGFNSLSNASIDIEESHGLGC
jgi:hypothetical protein